MEKLKKGLELDGLCFKTKNEDLTLEEFIKVMDDNGLEFCGAVNVKGDE